MVLAPRARKDDGRIEYLRGGPVGRIGTLTPLPGMYNGTHIESPMADFNTGSGGTVYPVLLEGSTVWVWRMSRRRPGRLPGGIPVDYFGSLN
jgi:hypothetical protein